MNQQGRILIIDDDEKWIDTLSRLLRVEGYHVDTATTIARAHELLNLTFFHLLVLDIRMEEDDESNAEGMDLLREIDSRDLSTAMQIIMLSAYGTPRQMRQAFTQYKVADFLSKDEFDDEEFLERVRTIFAEHVRANFALTCHWQNTTGSEQVVVNLEVDGQRVKRDSPFQQQIAEELNDLLARLFYKADSLLLRPLARGHSGSAVLWAQPFSADGAGQAVVVKFGDFRGIDQEYSHYLEHVQPFIGGGRSTSIISLRRTPRLGGIVYSMLGAVGDHLESFGSFYNRADIADIKGVLDRLFLDTCKPWYANRGPLKLLDLTEHYQGFLDFTTDKLERALSEGLKAVHGKHKLTFNALPGEATFTNPVLALADQRFVRSTYECKTHGDFNESNILVDAAGHTWLIDFESTGPGHILRDIGELDSVVRFQLLKVEEATLEERLRMEEVLSQIESFSAVKGLEGGLATENEAVAKAYATSAHLRGLASRLVEQNPMDDISELYVALVYYAMNTMRFYQLPSVQRQHALLSASLLAERLGF